MSGVPTALDPLTIEKTLDWIRSNLDGTPSAEQLRAIRTLLDDATFGWVNQIGLAGSGALVFGGILACLNPAIGVLAIIPVAGGIFVAGTSCFGMKRLDEERTLCMQLAERLSEIRKAMTE